ncbi:MAG: hydroxymethylglutaryl-CoA synthase [Chthoniobacter sp.]|jgi:hydroxymethylglutaryl-CoA synthase|nr:hydroxymethylglutaryl-CoA synthase [Chthoniobacter sp.]
MKVGIEKLRVYPCSMALSIEQLCAARGATATHVRDQLMMDERSLNPTWEDPATMAVNAARPMLTPEDIARIELLIVATESGLDQEKSITTWIHRHLGLKPNCRNFELKHACYAGTAALQMALGWIASGQAGEGKALIITTDESRMHLGEAYEFVLGAGAAALLVSSAPRLLEIEPGRSGYWTEDVSDLMRPTSRIEAGGGDLSVACYLDALEGAFDHFQRRVGGIDFMTHFKRIIYHAPFGGLTLLAHKALLGDTLDKESAVRDFERRSGPALNYVRRMGSTYSSSNFIALLALLDSDPELSPGDRLGIFSYGSGCCAEFYSALIGSDAKYLSRAAGLPALLDQRRPTSVAEYEAIEQERASYIDCGDYEPRRTNWYDEHYAGQGLLVFRGLRDFHRQYEWS